MFTPFHTGRLWHLPAALALACLVAPVTTTRAIADAPGGAAAAKLAHIEALIAEGRARDAMAEARALYLDLAARAGLSIARVTFTIEPATGYGVYEPRPDNRFAPDEPMHAYVELNGASVTERPGGVNEMLFQVDFAVLDAEGQRLTDVIRMGDVQLRSRARGVDVFLELTYNLTSAPAGDYVLWTEITDAPGDQQVSFELPVSIRAGN